MSFDLILSIPSPLRTALLDESLSDIMGNSDAAWCYERDRIICPETKRFLFTSVLG